MGCVSRRGAGGEAVPQPRSRNGAEIAVLVSAGAGRVPPGLLVLLRLSTLTPPLASPPGAGHPAPGRHPLGESRNVRDLGKI